MNVQLAPRTSLRSTDTNNINVTDFQDTLPQSIDNPKLQLYTPFSIEVIYERIR